MSPKAKRLLSAGSICFLFLWLAAVVSVLLTPALSLPQFLKNTNTANTQSDFIYFYRCADVVGSKDRHSLYDAQSAIDWTARLLAPHGITSPFANATNLVVRPPYPPNFLVLLAPLAALPINAAFISWMCLSLAAATAGMLMLMSLRADVMKMQKALLVLGALCSAPAILTLNNGQVSLVLLFLTAAFYYFLARQQDVWAGLALGLATMKPHYAIFSLVPVLRLRRWRIILVVALYELASLTLAGFVIGFDKVIQYPLLALSSESQGRAQGNNSGLLNFGASLGSSVDGRVALMVSVAVFVAALSCAFYIWRNSDSFQAQSTTWRWAAAITVLLAVCASPHIFMHDCMLLAIASCLTLTTFDLPSLIRSRNWTAFCYTGLFAVYPFLSWVLFMAAVSGSVPFVLMQVLNSLILVFAIANFQRAVHLREHSPDSVPSSIA